MDRFALELLIRNTILSGFAKEKKYFFPVAISARHLHLSKKDFERLFGPEKTMTRYKALSQPGQFACEELVEVAGPRGAIKKVRLLGPERSETQVEVSISDCFALGIKPEIRMSGDIERTPGCTLIGPAGKITIEKGVIVAARHAHMSVEQAAAYGLQDGDVISLKAPVPREGIIGNIAVRVGRAFELEVHLDTDEANGNGILRGTILEAAGMKSPGMGASNAERFLGGSVADSAEGALELVTERDVNNALLRGEKNVYCTVKGFITPAAVDRAKDKGIALCKLQG